MSGAILFVVLLIAASAIFAALKLLGLRVRFETIFKVLGLALVMLPPMVLGVVVLFSLEGALCMLVLGVLHVTGLLPNVADIPRQYVVFGLWGLMVLNIGYIGYPIVRYIIEV